MKKKGSRTEFWNWNWCKVLFKVTDRNVNGNTMWNNALPVMILCSAVSHSVIKSYIKCRSSCNNSAHSPAVLCKCIVISQLTMSLAALQTQRCYIWNHSSILGRWYFPFKSRGWIASLFLLARACMTTHFIFMLSRAGYGVCHVLETIAMNQFLTWNEAGHNSPLIPLHLQIVLSFPKELIVELSLVLECEREILSFRVYSVLWWGRDIIVNTMKTQ